MKWSHNKKRFCFSLLNVFLSLSTNQKKKKKIPWFLRQYDLFQLFFCFAYLEIIFTVRLWDDVYRAGISEMQPMLQCLEYFEELKTLPFHMISFHARASKMTWCAVYFHCQIETQNLSGFYTCSFSELKRKHFFLMSFSCSTVQSVEDSLGHIFDAMC